MSARRSGPVLAGGSLGVDPQALAGMGDEQRERVALQLKELEAAFRRNPLLGYRPHPKQELFHAAVGLDLRAYFGGNRAGKTTSTMVDSIIQAVDEDVIPEHLKPFKWWQPPFYCRVVTPDLSHTMEGVVLQKFREWCPKEQFRGGSFDRAWDKALRMIRFRNGSWFQFFSNDQDVDKFGGAALHRVVYDEEPRREIRNECRVRLLDYGGDELFGMTPLLGMSWVYEEVYEPWERGDLDPRTVVVVDMDDNPHLSKVQIERALAGATDEERQARKGGRFVHFEGLVYPQWDEAKHVIPTLEKLPAGVECFAGIDPGIRHMAAVVFAYVDEDDGMVVYDEIGVQGRTIREVCDLIHLVNARWGVTPRWYVIDPASRNKNHQTGRSDQQEFIDHGIVAFPGQNSIGAGLNRLKERLERDPPMLTVMAHCRELRREFKRYRWSRPKRLEGDPREQPVKADDHCLSGDTLVLTARGNVPISDVTVEDLVLTRQGWRGLLFAGMTSASAPTVRVRLANGSELTGTKEHPVWVSGYGWKALGSVRHQDKMLLCPNGWSSTELSIPARAATTLSPSRCTEPFGATTTGRSPTVSTSITSMEIGATTTYQISPAYPQKSTPRSIGRSLQTISGMLRRSGCAASSPRVAAGTAAPRAANSTCKPPSSSGSGLNLNYGSANNAASPSLRRTSTSLAVASAPDDARSLGTDHVGMTVRSGVATTAAPSSPSRNGRPQSVALVAVVSSCAAAERPVYNLTVDGPPEFYANGVLVHNCLDALRYVAMARPLPPQRTVATESITQSDRLLRAALDQFKIDSRPIEHPSGAGLFT